MADLLTRVQHELDERMTALRPLVEEARQLERALEALNGSRGASPAQRPPERTPAPAVERTPARALATPAAKPAPAPAAEAPTAAPEQDDAKTVRSRISRERADERRRQALAIITENPGTTASNLALLLDTSTGTMHSLLKRLESEGEIAKAEKGYARPKQVAS